MSMSFVSQTRKVLCQRQPLWYLWKSVETPKQVDLRRVGKNSQLLGGEKLMFVLRIRVEHKQQGIFCEVGDLLFYWLRISDRVALRKIELGQGRLLRRVIDEGDAVLSERPAACQFGDWALTLCLTHKSLAKSSPSSDGFMPCPKALYEGYLTRRAKSPLMPHLSPSGMPARGSCAVVFAGSSAPSFDLLAGASLPPETNEFRISVG